MTYPLCVCLARRELERSMQILTFIY